MRFFDGELIYSPKAINMLLRALQASSCQERQNWFEQVMGVRRRMRRKWQECTISSIFTLRSEFHLLYQRALMMRVRLAIAQRRLSTFDAFCLFDSAKNGRLTPGMLWSALDFLQVPAEARDVIDLMRTCDAEGDRMISWVGFCQMVQNFDENLSQMDTGLITDSVIEMIEIDPEEVVLVPRDDTALSDLWMEIDKQTAEDLRTAKRDALKEDDQRDAELEYEVINWQERDF